MKQCSRCIKDKKNGNPDTAQLRQLGVPEGCAQRYSIQRTDFFTFSTDTLPSIKNGPINRQELPHPGLPTRASQSPG